MTADICKLSTRIRRQGFKKILFVYRVPAADAKTSQVESHA